MKKKIQIYQGTKKVDKIINYIPVRYIFALLLTALETILVIGVVVGFSIYIPYFWVASIVTQFVVVICIVCSNDNPDYKVPWLLFVMILPIIGYMIYFMFYKRKLTKKMVKKINKVNDSYIMDDSNELNELKKANDLAYSQAVNLRNISNVHVYNDTDIKYYPIGEEWFSAVMEDLKQAKSFIFFEFFIVENGLFWDSILEVLKEKVKEGVMVKTIWDDIGCMSTLPGHYYKELQKYGIDAIPFSRLKGQADNEFNNRNHRKILVIDGNVGFSGGINIADEYINNIVRFGHWKDMGIRLEGAAVNELTKLFLVDFYSNKKEIDVDFDQFYVQKSYNTNSYVIPFGDGPKPIYEHSVGKSVIMNMLNQAKKYVYMTTPYLIVDSEMLNAIKNAALRGIDVRIIVPHIPDKKMVFEFTRDACETLIKYGVKIYEYEPGFVHGKLYVSDDEIAMIGTINLDYRSLTHHFENGVWMYNTPAIMDMKQDILNTIDKSIYINDNPIKVSKFKRLIRFIGRIVSPLL